MTDIAEQEPQPLITDEDVAKWIFDKILEGGWVYQENIVTKVKKQFGNDYVYTNENGNPAISKDVLKKFKKLKDNIESGEIVWDRSERAWRYYP